jgi:hypothetical protein
MDEQHNTITAALRQAANLLEQHPQLPQPYITTLSNGRAKVSWYLPITHGVASQKAIAATILRTLGGHWDKRTVAGVDDFYFDSKLGLLDLTVNVDRPAVCERVVVGTETVTIPAVEAQPARTETREIVRWDCRPLLADDQAETAAVTS